MVNSNRIRPVTTHTTSSSKDLNDLDSLSTLNLEETSYLKLKPFRQLDPTLVRLLTFLSCFGITVDYGNSSIDKRGSRTYNYAKFMKISFMILVGYVSGEVVYNINLQQSKLLAEQKRSTPLLTFVIISYSWLTIIIPVICDLSLVLFGSHLFRFYSRTTATVCDGKFAAF